MELYGDLKKEDPLDMPPPIGRAVSITGFVDVDHGSNVVVDLLGVRQYNHYTK